MTLQDWFPVITLVLGAVLTLIGGLISEHYKTEASLKRAKQERDRQDNLARTTFQRDNVLQLQDTGQDLVALTLQCLAQKWPDDPRPTANPDQRQPRPLSEETRLARAGASIRANKLASRLPDQQDRERINELLYLSYNVIKCDDFKVAQEKLQEMEGKFIEANETILGPILRNTWVLSAGS